MEAAESMFNSVNDPKLIEAAIYREEAAKRKFDYLLSVAKEQYSREQEKENEEMEYLLPVACRSTCNCNFKNIVYGRSETR